MSLIISVEHARLTLNGHLFSSYSQDEDAIMFPEIELTNEEVGATGQMFVASTGERGGEVMLKFMPNSQDVIFLQQQAQVGLAGGAVVWNGTLDHSQGNFSVSLSNGVLKKFPSAFTMGKGSVKTMEYTFRFELIQNNMDAATTGNMPPLTAQA